MDNHKTDIFELNNLQRRYLGLDEVQPHWDWVELTEGVALYFDGDVVRKMIVYSTRSYHESDHHELTAENRTILLPKTKRGKPRKMNYTATRSFSYKGVYFDFSSDFILIGNYTTQTTFYSDDNPERLTMEEWLDKWVEETTEQNLDEIRRFKDSPRKHQKYAEGDFFTFKIGRNKWGFGRIVLNVTERRKSEEFKKSNYGLESLMGKALFIAIYRTISDSPEADIDELRQCDMLPTQAIMDNRFYYGEYRIIGNRPMEPDEWEPLISYSKTCSRHSSHSVAYLQYGLICETKDGNEYDRYLIRCEYSGCRFENEAIGFGIMHYSRLEEIIGEGIDNDALLRKDDLRKKANRQAKREIFSSLGLDADKSYAENLRLLQHKDECPPAEKVKRGLLATLLKMFNLGDSSGKS